MKKWFVRAGWALLGLLLLAAGVLALYVRQSLPRLEGALNLPGLSAPVTVERDAADVAHIRAANALDAWRALGYVHAQERGWQLEFNRRLMRGELSEILGPGTLEIDQLLRALGIIHHAQRQLAGMPQVLPVLQAYSEGVNAFIDQGGGAQARAPEFALLGVQPGHWTPTDSVGWSLMMALDLAGNWGNEWARLANAQVLSTEQLWQLMPLPYASDVPASRVDFAQFYRDLGVYKDKAASGAAGGGAASAATHPSATLQRATPSTPESATESAPQFATQCIAETPASTCRSTEKTQPVSGPDAALPSPQWAAQYLAGLGLLEGVGSNNWVVAGSHTESGKPLLANDPHLALGAPALWYFAHLSAPAAPPDSASAQALAALGLPADAALDVIGATFPGLPLVVLGRTAGVAWGFTNTGPDTQDLYLEQINPDNPAQYRTPEGWASFETRSETFKVKGQPDLIRTLRRTRHGPVLSDAQASHGALLDTRRYVLALRWNALDDDNHTAIASTRVNFAQTVPQLKAAYAAFHSPMQNVVMADTAGAVAYKAVGTAPLRSPDNDLMGLAPAPGWDARYDWTGQLSYAQTPEDDPAATAAQGWHATANQRIHAADYPFFIGQEWTEPDRYNRIAQLLAATPRHSIASMAAIQRDQLSSAALRIVPHLRRALAASAHPRAKDLQAPMQAFDGTMGASSTGALVLSVWADELTRGLIAPKLGQARFDAQYGKRSFRTAVEGILQRNDAAWCAPLSCDQQSAAALDRALNRIEKEQGANVAHWQWGQVHFAKSVHRPFSNVALLAPLFEVREPTGGDIWTINVGQYWANDPETPFANRHAASLRALYDLNNPENSLFIYQTGQSGNPLDPRYRDMSRAWSQTQYRPLKMNPDEVKKRLVLRP